MPKKVCSAGSILGTTNFRAQELIPSATNVNKTFLNSKNILVNSHKLNCIYTNIGQLSNKFIELELLINRDQPDIVLITEVNPNNSRYCPIAGEFVINGYSMWQTNIESITGRGCIILSQRKT